MAGNWLTPVCAVVILAFVILPENAPVAAQVQFPTPTGLPHAAMIGSKSYFGHMILDQDYTTKDVHDMRSWDQVALLYLNANAMLQERDLAIASNAVRAGVPVLIDGTADYNSIVMKNVSTRIGGVGFDDAIIMIRKSPGRITEYKVLLDEDVMTESAAAEESKEEALRKLADLAREMLSRQNAEIEAEGYKPEASIAVELSRSIKCKVPAKYAGSGLDGYWTNEMIEDACNGGGTVSLFFNIDLIRSVPSNGGAENAKYVRITLDPKASGGSGFHLVDKPTHKHTWFQSWTNRNCLFYPIAADYRMEVYPSDNDVRLYNAKPNNLGKDKTVQDTTGITIGVEAGAQAGTGSEGPTVGGSLSASFQYSSSRSVTYKVHEYTVENHSKGNQARWIWDRKWGSYASDWRTHDTCALWCNSWFWDDSEFSAAAYKNYKPGFTATYRADADKRGTTTFNIKPGITVDSLGGRVQYAFWYQKYSPYSMKGFTHLFRKSFDVNWDGPIFQPEVTVSIEVINYPGLEHLCLDVDSNVASPGQHVIPYGCHYRNNQLWGLDQYQRYKPRIGANLCMNAKSDCTVTIETCSTSSARQKWQWSDKYLKPNSGGYLAIIDGNLRVTPNVNKGPTIHHEFKNYIRTPGVKGSINVVG